MKIISRNLVRKWLNEAKSYEKARVNNNYGEYYFWYKISNGYFIGEYEQQNKVEVFTESIPGVYKKIVEYKNWDSDENNV